MKFNNTINSITTFYKNMSNFGKILLFLSLFLILIVFFKSLQMPKREGFEQKDNFLFKKETDIYDNFYSEIYDYLVFNSVKNNYEIGQIINTTSPSNNSKILDVGSGTGHHVAELAENNLDVIGIDISPSMVQKAKENFPEYSFKVANALDNGTFNPNTFTHILCMYFTIYYFEDKKVFFNNAMDWLVPGGYLIIHLVDREKFDPILPPGNPLYVVSPQKYAKERITKTKVRFNEFEYSSNFNLDKDKNMAIFDEKFKFNNGKVRKQEHKFYMEDKDVILGQATEAGFIVKGKINLVKCAYENQYLYILVKPE
uniref:Methyltransferase domain-containing protein n=1 Tax=viral metagenome TaxID=1070528 RepID=A0A6C0IF93_9ZZZZ